MGCLFMPSRTQYLKKIVYQKIKNDYSFSYYLGCGLNFEYFSYKYSKFYALNGHEYYIDYPNDILPGDMFGEFWNLDTTVIINDNIVEKTYLNSVINVPIGIKIERELPLIISQNIFLEIDAELFSPFISFEKVLSKYFFNKTDNLIENFDDDYNFIYGVNRPKLNLYLKYYF